MKGLFVAGNVEFKMSRLKVETILKARTVLPGHLDRYTFLLITSLISTNHFNFTNYCFVFLFYHREEIFVLL